MNDHPGRDTDVISRPSKSTIKDLSFYIGFTRIGSRIKDLGPCFGMNGHSRRAMDVLLRLSRSTINFLPFYIGVTRIGSRIKDLGSCFDMNLDLGPCFGMNGHPRRDMDVILRLSKSTIDFLSFYIGFGS